MIKDYINLAGNRGSGRTTRMLFDAALRVAQGHDVFVVVHDTQTIPWIELLAHQLLSEAVIKRMTFIQASSTRIVHNKSGLVVLGHSLESTFVDHHVYAVLLQGVNSLIEGFTKYDN